MERYRQNTILLLSIAQQPNDPCTTITYNAIGTTIEETYCDTLNPTHICTNNKRNRNAKLIKSFKTHLNKSISKG